MGKHEFFQKMDDQGLALTYSDVRLRTGPSSVPAYSVDLTTRFSRNVPLNIPIVSAAMDTVTEAPMAIALAKLGGIGIIHAGLTPEEQARQVKRVKYYLGGRIANPITIRSDRKIGDVLELRAEKGYGFHSFPVVDMTGKLVGLVTQNDFDFCSDLSKRVSDIMTADPVAAPTETTLDEAYDIMTERKKKTLPLINADGMVEGLYIFSDVARIKRDESALYNVDGDQRLRVGAAVGTDPEALERVALMRGKVKVDVVVVDTARGDSLNALTTLKALKKAHPDLDVVVGNISEGRSAELLAKSGADGIKVGQGPGSICTTRIVAGVGCPQVTAVYNCSRAVESFGIPVCADGGITQSGDIPIALGAGASSIMAGSLFAGTDESPGEIVIHQGVRMVPYRGMGSAAAMRESKASRKRYGDQENREPVPEGVESYIPYKGALGQVVYQQLGGLRKGMEYVGAANIVELQDKADFHRITGAGVREMHPHDVVVRPSDGFGGV